MFLMMLKVWGRFAENKQFHVDVSHKLWDVSLKGEFTGTYIYLYILLDIVLNEYVLFAFTVLVQVK